jgi:hypothetical protein
MRIECVTNLTGLSRREFLGQIKFYRCPFNVRVSSFDPEAELKPKLATAEAFARKDRKYSMNENEFSNDIFTKVNHNECMKDMTAER